MTLVGQTAHEGKAGDWCGIVRVLGTDAAGIFHRSGVWTEADASTLN